MMKPKSSTVDRPLFLTSFLTQRVHVPNNLVLGSWVVVVITVQVWGEYLIIGYLDP